MSAEIISESLIVRPIVARVSIQSSVEDSSSAKELIDDENFIESTHTSISSH